MKLAHVAASLVLWTACRGEPDHHAARAADPKSGSDRASSVVPKLPRSESGDDELRIIDRQIEIHRVKPDDIAQVIDLYLTRAGIRGDLEDYQAALALTATWLERSPDDLDAMKARVRALSRVHRFADARAELALIKQRPKINAGEWQPLEATIDEATGKLALSLPEREQMAKMWPSPTNLTQLAGALGLECKYDEALAVMPKAAAAVRDNSPVMLTWLLFQWGRLYEQKGEMAAARELYAAARDRMPGSLEAIVHLAQTMIATGDSAAAKPIVQAALAADRHPELVALAANLDQTALPLGSADGRAQVPAIGPEHKAALIAEARAGWERYLAALPEAFSDHAARFYLGVGGDPARALVLAQANLANRDTVEARELVVDAALAAGAAAQACAVVEPLRDPALPHAARFKAWQALSRCGRTADAERLAGDLGIK